MTQKVKLLVAFRRPGKQEAEIFVACRTLYERSYLVRGGVMRATEDGEQQHPTRQPANNLRLPHDVAAINKSCRHLDEYTCGSPSLSVSIHRVWARPIVWMSGSRKGKKESGRGDKQARGEVKLIYLFSPQ